MPSPYRQLTQKVSPYRKKVEEIGEIKEFSPREAFIAGLKRKGAIAAKGVTPPMLRRFLPEQIQQVKPFTGAEKGQTIATELARNIGEFYLGGKGAGALAKVPLISKAGQVVSKIPKVGGVITKTIIPELTRGAIFGGLEAKEPKDIPREAALMGTIFAGVPLALKGVGVAGRGILKGAEKIGLKLPKIPDVKTKVIDLIRKRYGDIQSSLLDSEIFVRNIIQNLTVQERKLIPFIRERYLTKEARQQILRNPQIRARYPVLKEYASKVGEYLDDAHKFLVENYGDDVGFVQDFIPHIWDIPKNRQREVVNWFITRNPHLKKRLIPTLKEGIEKLGLRPRYDDVADIIRVYDQYKIKTVANLKFATGLTGLVDEGGVKLIQRIDKAPTDWVTIDHPALRRAMGRVVGEAKEKILMLNKVPVKVHPDIANEIKVVLDRPFSSAGARAMDTINAFVKKANLSFSLFHHIALTETGGATPTVGRRMLQLWNPVRIWKAMKTGNYGVFENIPLSRDAVKHGLSIGPIADVQVGRIRQALANLEFKTKSIPVLRHITKGMRSFNTMWDKGLWDYYHTSLKLYGYEGLVQKGLKEHPELPAKVIKQEVSQFVNDTFGGQAWDLLLKNPKWQQSMHWLLLSPDWTLSTVRQAISPTGAGAVSALGRQLRSEMGQEFWKKAIIYFWGGINLLNKGLTEAYTGKGRYMWENAPEHKTHLFIGFNQDGTERYLRWGKQFRELPEFFINPVKKAWSKVSPVIRMIQTQVRPHPVWQKEFEGKPFWGTEEIAGRGKAFVKGLLPYATAGVMRARHPLGFAFPISKGMTPYKARELFRDAIERKDINRLKEVWASALNNNLNAQTLFKNARSSVKSDITFEFKREAYKIINKLRALGKEKGMLELRRMTESGEIGPELNKQLIKIIRQQQSIRQQQQKLQEIRQ